MQQDNAQTFAHQALNASTVQHCKLYSSSVLARIVINYVVEWYTTTTQCSTLLAEPDAAHNVSCSQPLLPRSPSKRRL